MSKLQIVASKEEEFVDQCRRLSTMKRSMALSYGIVTWQLWVIQQGTALGIVDKQLVRSTIQCAMHCCLRNALCTLQLES
ncbi:unnamed protein product [Peronospora belbahrii]|uniref:Uncharacterized protein n=1 Tax=Peronospora belbahrii TaxID=622444 RepID=A0AAU9LDF1_9STRA|nr:unnamed protein product [Peronospora belbahrii]